MLFRKYTLGAGGKDTFSIIVDTDPSDSNIQIARQSNMPKRMNYNASLSIPTQITKWWILNANLNVSSRETR
ncbi:MAG: outer membrane beta-barrel protein [Alistipes indistinctus]